jgi:hypothetical protein
MSVRLYSTIEKSVSCFFFFLLLFFPPPVDAHFYSV